MSPKTSGCSRRGSERHGGADRRLPIGVCLRAIRAEPMWWLESARRLDAAGYRGLWCWDHFMGRGDPTVPVVEGWTILSMAAAQTIARHRGPVRAQRHEPPPGPRGPDGGHAADRERRPAGPGHRHRRGARGACRLRDGLPGPARTGRAPRGGHRGHPRPVDRWAGHARVAVLPADGRRARIPIPIPPPPIIIGGETPAGARLAGRIGDGWSAFDDNFEANLPLYLESLETAGRRREDQRVHRRVPGRLAGRRGASRQRRGSTDPRETWARWHAAGADEAIVLARTTDDVDALVGAVDRW